MTAFGDIATNRLFDLGLILHKYFAIHSDAFFFVFIIVFLNSFRFVFVAINNTYLPVCFREQIKSHIINAAEYILLALVELNKFQEADLFKENVNLCANRPFLLLLVFY